MIALPGSSVSDLILDRCEPISALLSMEEDFVLYRTLFGRCCPNAERKGGIWLARIFESAE
jgi:hypothetical protein